MTLNFASALCDLEELGIGGGEEEEEEEEEGMAKARRDEARQVLLTDFCRLIPPDPPYGSFFGFPSSRFIINAIQHSPAHSLTPSAVALYLHPPRAHHKHQHPRHYAPRELRFLSQSLVPEADVLISSLSTGPPPSEHSLLSQRCLSFATGMARQAPSTSPT